MIKRRTNTGGSSASGGFGTSADGDDEVESITTGDSYIVLDDEDFDDVGAYGYGDEVGLNQDNDTVSVSSDTHASMLSMSSREFNDTDTSSGKGATTTNNSSSNNNNNNSSSSSGSINNRRATKFALATRLMGDFGGTQRRGRRRRCCALCGGRAWRVLWASCGLQFKSAKAEAVYRRRNFNTRRYYRFFIIGGTLMFLAKFGVVATSLANGASGRGTANAGLYRLLMCDRSARFHF